MGDAASRPGVADSQQLVDPPRRRGRRFQARGPTRAAQSLLASYALRRCRRSNHDREPQATSGSRHAFVQAAPRRRARPAKGGCRVGQDSCRIARARNSRARPASRRDRVAHARTDLRHRRRLAAVGGRLRGRLGSRVRGDAPRLRRERRRLAGDFSLPAGSYEYKAALNDSWDENYGLHAQSNGANIPSTSPRRRASSSTTTTRATGHRQQELGDRAARRQLPVRARLPGRLGPTASARGSRTPTATASTRS